MIRFTLHCPQDHRFDSWFASNAAFDSLRASGHLACPDCGDSRIDKSLMTPKVRPARAAATAEAPAPDPDRIRTALAALRREIEANAEDVGTDFVDEARAIHLGDRPARSIYGQARPEQARALVEEGVPIARLPFIPTRKTN